MSADIMNRDEWEDWDELSKARADAVIRSEYDGTDLGYDGDLSLYEWIRAKRLEKGDFDDNFIDTRAIYDARIPDWTKMEVWEIIEKLSDWHEEDIEEECPQAIEELIENERQIKEQGPDGDLLGLLFDYPADEFNSFAYTYRFTDDKDRSIFFSVYMAYGDTENIEGPFKEEPTYYTGNTIGI